MAYIKYKEITKYFNFSRVLDKTKLPWYVYDYIFEEETILAAYKTTTDHGVFTTHKIVLYDNYSLFRKNKHIYTIPYKTISTASIFFSPGHAEIDLYLDSGYPVRLKFVDVVSLDKQRLRLLYTVIVKNITNQKVTNAEIERLVKDEIEIPEGGK